jgi:hypothetical protein
MGTKEQLRAVGALNVPWASVLGDQSFWRPLNRRQGKLLGTLAQCAPDQAEKIAAWCGGDPPGLEGPCCDAGNAILDQV